MWSRNPCVCKSKLGYCMSVSCGGGRVGGGIGHQVMTSCVICMSVSCREGGVGGGIGHQVMRSCVISQSLSVVFFSLNHNITLESGGKCEWELQISDILNEGVVMLVFQA